ncbi:putative transcriptional regulator, TetR family protein [Mycolicibacterium chitae]|uniref:TetR family transcriptional regulator n=1 Tax=Mycolicibacterium chitae TaxID=1792 RepID=A0A448I6C2_MYCCI|nr:TetR/AcrR family transcriptional regulator [Mycolicibacterium chitae]MCV7106694.1 TetR/AcrR family transcriptional regulator [Mycolicibacterium chitae]BBZ04434.1 putative transcriptional regulator, TetR family protein [Mycolicibacterium chitae]VEG48069.1 TetR family transcriptional regulator [Mycolicibacterium chitae]
MGRAPRFDADTLLDAARELLLTRGPAGLTVQGVVTALGAPSGSVYYRFANRDLLAAEVWLRAVERFQAGLTAAVAAPDPLDAAVRSALHVLEWSRANRADASVLMLYRPRDLLPDGWPTAVRPRNEEQLAAVSTYLSQLSTRSGTDPLRVRFAVIDVPYAAVRPALLRGRAPEPELDDLVEATVRTTLAHPTTTTQEEP